QVAKTGDRGVIAKDIDEMGYVGIGTKIRLDGGWGLRLDGRVLFPPSSATEFATVDGEGLVSVYREFGRPEASKKVEAPPPAPADSDGDGLTDDADKCPQEAEDKDGFQDDDGCPDPDNDAD